MLSIQQTLWDLGTKKSDRLQTFLTVLSVSAEPSYNTNLEEDMVGADGASDGGNGGGEIDQESLRQSEEMMKAFMKATGGVEDETNKQERTKAIIKTIKVGILHLMGSSYGFIEFIRDRMYLQQG